VKYEPLVPIEIEKPVFTLVGTKLLVVDDDEDTRLMLNDFFSRCGAEVVIASSAIEAREKIVKYKPDIFVFDIGMPDEDGYSLIRSFRAKGHLTPALALTAFVGKEYEDAAKAAGFDGYIPKPAGLDYIGRKVQDLKDKDHIDT
jgi:CheY-like chemotaxis protein